MAEAAYAGWRADMLAGKTTLMTAASGSDVAALSAQARAERVDAGQVETGGAPLRDGTLAGRGDWIVTRENNRRFAVHGGRDWVKNGDAWRVIKRDRDGSVRAEHLTHRGRVTLPADYVAAHVQLLYATTAHRAEGSTVDTAHALITPEMSRESFYVTASRARLRTVFYAATHDLLSPDEDDRLDAVRTDPRSYAAREVLENVLAREGAELSATESIRVAQEQAGSLSTLVPRYNHAAQLAAEAGYRRTVLEVLGADNRQLLVLDPAWGAVVRALKEAEALGWRARELLTEVVDLRELATARSMAEVIAWRIDAYSADRPAPPRLDQPTEADALRYASLLLAVPVFNLSTLDPAAALEPIGAWLRESGEVRRPAQRTAESAPITDVAAGVLGATLAGRARSEPAWPALKAALRRAERRGHDPAALLDKVARSRELRTARSISEVLAWRIGGYLANEHTAAAVDLRSGVPELGAPTWAMLAWALKAAENSGRDAGELVASASDAPDIASAVFAVTQAAGTHEQASALPPWISAPAASSADCRDADKQIVDYLNTAADEIRKRVNALTADATRMQPAWVQALGAVPGHDARHQEWLRHVGVVAAYRDQYQVSSDDPRQVLGPCAEPGHAGHAAYWRAAASILTARTIAGLKHADPGKNDIGTQLVADLYLGLPPDERAVVSAAMAERLGVLWFGAHGQADDHAATRPMYASQLAAVLNERGHLSYELSARESLSRGSDPILVADEEPVEAAFARRRANRAAQGSARDNARRRETRHSQTREKATRSPQAVPARSTAAGPTERGQDPALLPQPRTGTQPRNPRPVQ